MTSAPASSKTYSCATPRPPPACTSTVRSPRSKPRRASSSLAIATAWLRVGSSRGEAGRASDAMAHRATPAIPTARVAHRVRGSDHAHSGSAPPSCGPASSIRGDDEASPPPTPTPTPTSGAGSPPVPASRGAGTSLSAGRHAPLYAHSGMRSTPRIFLLARTTTASGIAATARITSWSTRASEAKSTLEISARS